MENKLTNREYLGSYLTGLFEGVGNIYIPKNNGCPKITYSLNKKNRPLLEAIQERTKIGKIYEKKTACTYEIFDKVKFIELTNKYLRTPIIQDYNNMIEYLNNNKNCNLSKVEIDNSELDSNSWLSGYLEANGSFEINEDLRTNYYHYSLEFKLAHQKQNKKKKCYKLFFDSLAKYLNVPLKEKKRYSKDIETNQFYIYVGTLTSTQKLINYLVEHPLFGIKYLDFESYYYAFKLKIDNDLAKKIIYTDKLVIEFKNKMNKGRTEFKVNHLDKLPRLD